MRAVCQFMLLAWAARVLLRCGGAEQWIDA